MKTEGKVLNIIILIVLEFHAYILYILLNLPLMFPVQMFLDFCQRVYIPTSLKPMLSTEYMTEYISHTYTTYTNTKIKTKT